MIHVDGIPSNCLIARDVVSVYCAVTTCKWMSDSQYAKMISTAKIKHLTFLS